MDSKKNDIVIALMVAMFLGAVEGTVVTTAIPTIVKDLKGFELISWVFSLYFLTSAISTPIYGKLADLYGRKNILSIGIIIFILGSGLCGLSQSMYQLIAFRTLQGLGAGAIFTVTYTIIGDIFTLEERAKVQGLISSVWGIASIAGPLLGGFLIDKLSWHWIFYINIPFGILSVVLLQKNLKENFQKKKHKIDYLGTLVLSIAIAALLYGFLAGEKSSIGFKNSIILSLLLSSGMLVIFYFVEKKAKEPIIPFEIFTKTSIFVNLICFLTSAVLIGTDVYIPIYVQYVLGFSAMVSGFAMAPMSVSWLLSSVVIAKALPRYGERKVTVWSMLILLISCILLATLRIRSPLVSVMLYSLIMGFGLGGSFTVLTIVIQISVDYKKRGVATSTNSLVRTLGQAIAISIFGGIFNLTIVNYFKRSGITGIVPNNLYSSSGLNQNVSAAHIMNSLNSGLHILFLVFICITAAGLILSFTLPSELKDRT